MAHNCTKCGKHEDRNWIPEAAQELAERQLCHSCNYWWTYLYAAEKPDMHHHHSTAVVIDGHVYTDGGRVSNPNAPFVGHAGREFRIRMLDGSRELSTNNLWSGGKVPELWRPEIPDTAEFIPSSNKEQA